MVLRRDVPVHAQHLVVARPVLHRLERRSCCRSRPVGSVAFGSGNRLSSACADRVDPVGRDDVAREARRAARRCALHVPGQLRVADEQTAAPDVSNVCEKSPLRSSAVGMRRSFRPPGSVRCRMSCEKKKNSLLRPLLKSVPGISTGPPSVHASLSNV